MQPDNPYSAPQVELLDSVGVQSLPGWSARQLQVLGWLALVSVVANALVVGLTFAGALLEADEAALLFTYTDWLSLALALLGCYLLLRFKTFAEARFFARNLSVPIWLLLAVTLLLEAVDMLFGDQLFAGLDWQTIGYMALLCLMRGEALFIDVAVLLALVSFLGTAAFAFLFDDAHSQMPEKREERP